MLYIFSVRKQQLDYVLYQGGPLSSFDDIQHCFKMWQQWCSHAPTANKKLTEEGNVLWQRKSIFNFNKGKFFPSNFFQQRIDVVTSTASPFFYLSGLIMPINHRNINNIQPLSCMVSPLLPIVLLQVCCKSCRLLQMMGRYES